jgi:hypothetical protein
MKGKEKFDLFDTCNNNVVRKEFSSLRVQNQIKHIGTVNGK